MFLINADDAATLRGVSEEVMMVSETNREKQFDPDILQCKKDILSAFDIMPPFVTNRESKPQKTNENTPSPGKEKEYTEDASSISDEKIKDGNERAGSFANDSEKFKIPKFNLAEQIMSEHRKKTAIKRKAPSSKQDIKDRQQQTDMASYKIEQSIPTHPEQDKIIAQIVARDIQELLKRSS